jgi:hypothetical protein
MSSAYMKESVLFVVGLPASETVYLPKTYKQEVLQLLFEKGDNFGN